MSPTQYDLAYELRVTIARLTSEVENLTAQLADAAQERDRLFELIWSHRVSRMYVGRVIGSDERLWEGAGLAPYNPPEIKGDM